MPFLSIRLFGEFSAVDFRGNALSIGNKRTQALVIYLALRGGKTSLGEIEVLADMSTAAGGEIFAAAIRGNNRGKFVGVTTYGKAIVQKFISLPSGGGVQMTVGHYTTPDLKPITETGVKPDVTVDLSAQAIEDPEAKEKETVKEDLILQKALQLFGVKAPEKAEEKKAA